jgi:protein O-mannosyl-transferase
MKKSKRTKKRGVAPKKRAVRSFVPEAWTRLHWLAVAVLFVAATLPYWQSLPYEYVLDDTVVIEQNQFVSKGLAGVGEIFSTESFQGYFGEQKNLLVGARYRPLSLAMFAAEVEFFGKKPWIGHLGNILVYGIGIVLLFFTLYKMGLGSGSSHVLLGVPFWATLLFAVHPLHTEAVANIKGRDELLAFLFMAAAIWSSLQWVDKGGLWRMGLVFLWSFLGMMSKENALSLVPIVPLTVYFFRSGETRVWMRSAVPVALAALAYLLIRRAVIGFWLDSGVEVTDIMNNPFAGLATGERLATVMYTLLEYLRLMVFPHPLTHDYYPYQVPIMHWGMLWPWLGFFAYAAVTFYAFRGLRRKRVMSYGIFFYLLSLFLVSNLPFTVGTFMNERFVFTPLLGYTLVLSWLFLRKIPKRYGISSRWMAGALTVIALLFSGKSAVRVPAWENTMTLNRASIQVSTNSARANLFMGTALFKEYQAATDVEQKKHYLTEAGYYIRRSVEIHPNYGSGMNMLAGVAAEEYAMDRDLDKLLDNFEEIIRKRPGLKYISEYLEYLNKKTGFHDRLVRFYIHVGYEVLAVEMRQYQSALHYLNYGMQIAPGNRQLLEAVGRTYRLAGNEAKAVEFLSSAGVQ